MKRQIRQSIFETNSSSTHTFTCYYKASEKSVEEELKELGITEDNRTLKLGLGWSVDEDGDCSFIDKLSMVLSSIPDFYNKNYQKTHEPDDLVYVDIFKEEFLSNDIVQYISSQLKERYNIELDFPYFDKKEPIVLYRVYTSEEYDDPTESSIVFKDDFYNDKELIMEFITSPLYRMGVSEYYNG